MVDGKGFPDQWLDAFPVWNRMPGGGYSSSFDILY
jgi:hypothetical protein